MIAPDEAVATANVTVLRGDCIDVMRTMPDASVDAIVTDPPPLVATAVLAAPEHSRAVVGGQDMMFDVDTPPVRVPTRRPDNGRPKWSAYNPANRVKCDDCMLVLLESKGEGPAALPAHWKRVQSGADLLLCYSHARARRAEDGLELLEGM